MGKKIGILILILATLSSCQTTNRIIQSISNHNKVECEIIGYDGEPSIIYQEFEKLKKKANKKKLSELTNYHNVAVVVYSAYSLIDKELVEPSELFERFLKNDKFVETECTCISSEESVSSLIYQWYWDSRLDSYDVDNDIVFLRDSNELLKMDSLILHTDNIDEYLLRNAIRNRIYPPSYNLRIEELAFEDEYYFAIKYLTINNYEELKEKLHNTIDEFISENPSQYKEKEINELLKKKER